MTRIEKLQTIANENGVKAAIKELGNNIFANINGVSFKVQGLGTFEAKCKELKNYQAPEPIDLTSRLTKIEENTVRMLG
ncbi:hypothetical protein [Litchfieldia alkalitelluris]|uniref:hypothetical protein n=1 Tax=Litchfieldia alkalitelluris TaxID=304268 RepID=UPI000998E877|nr:hypothetical protein [Litchfieldia alkalitelluris]